MASVTTEPRMVMIWRGQTVNQPVPCLPQHQRRGQARPVSVPQAGRRPGEGDLLHPAGDGRQPEVRLRRGLTERFDGSIGAGSVLMPFGGKTQRTPAQAMAALFPVEPGRRPIRPASWPGAAIPAPCPPTPTRGQRTRSYASVAKLVAAGADYRKAYLTLRSSLRSCGTGPPAGASPSPPPCWGPGRPVGAGLRRHRRQGLHVGHLPRSGRAPTLISFATAPHPGGRGALPEFKEAGTRCTCS